MVRRQRVSHMRCICGFRIVDITDNLPYKAWFLPDEDVDHALDDLLKRVAEFIGVH